MDTGINAFKFDLSVESDFKNHKRTRDPSLDFRSIRAGTGVNAIHPYPAMFHPQLVKILINNFSMPGDTILDPFVGSGVSAVEASSTARKFVGLDINGLALLIAKSRTTPIKIGTLMCLLRDISISYDRIIPISANFPNINFWFSKYRIDSISKLLQAINSLDDEEARDFYKVVLSETIRYISNTNPSEFKLVRRKKPCVKSTISVFNGIALKNIASLRDHYVERQIKYQPHLKLCNILNDPIPIKNDSITLLLTSPPYGDSQTTVAYGQFSRLSLQWLGLPYNTDRESLGAKPIEIQNDLPSNIFYNALSNIEEKDIKRARHVYSFYKQFYLCLKKLVPKVKRGGHLIFVVGNRTVKGIKLPTDIICADMLESLGCEHLESRVREIGNKRMPSKNSPSNIVGEKSPTMKYEYIVICKKK